MSEEKKKKGELMGPPGRQKKGEASSPGGAFEKKKSRTLFSCVKKKRDIGGKRTQKDAGPGGGWNPW